MAQVTMTGAEYAELIKKEDRLKELINYLSAERTFVLTDDDFGSYRAGNFETRGKMPVWLQEMYVVSLLSYLVNLPKEQFKELVRGGYHYYNVWCPTLKKESWDHHDVDILNYSPDFTKKWNKIKAQIEAEEEEQNNAV